jgi:hypothetical protein
VPSSRRGQTFGRMWILIAFAFLPAFLHATVCVEHTILGCYQDSGSPNNGSGWEGVRRLHV